jgi:serine/threonine protein kinase
MSVRESQEEPSLISGKYEILGLAGRGGTGVVYKVRHVALDTIFALKVLPLEFRDNTEIVNRFHQEARVMARFNHPNIVRVSDVDKDGNTPYFVMEYVEGQSLSEYLADRGALSVLEALGIARQVALALDYAHGHASPVIHRDIKPQNILLETHSRRAVVTDFGIAKVRGASTRTNAELMLGTLLYCAPEQVLPNSEIDGRADLYSLGLVLYEMVARRPFFADLDERALLGKMLYGPEDNIPVFAPGIPPEFALLVQRAISRKPEGRHQSAKDLLKDIDFCLTLPPSSLNARSSSHPSAAGSVATAHPQRDALVPPEEPPPPLLRRPIGLRHVLALTSGLLLVAVVSLSWFLTPNQTDPSDPVRGNPAVVAAVAPPDSALAPPQEASEAPPPQGAQRERQPQPPSLPLPVVPAVVEGTGTQTQGVTTSAPPSSEPSPGVVAIAAEGQSEKEKTLVAPVPAEGTGAQAMQTPVPPPLESPPDVTAPAAEGQGGKEKTLASVSGDQPFPVPRRFRITTRTAVRESPTWAGREMLWLQPGARVYAVARVGEWLKIESRANPPKPPGFVWKADARRE